MSAPRPSRRLAISLRVLLLAVLALGLWLGWLAQRARQQRLAVAAIRDYGGFAYYEHQMVRLPNGGLKPDPTLEPAAPLWLRRLLGDDYFQRAALVNLIFDDTNGELQLTARTDDAVLAHLEQLDDLRALYLHQSQATDDGLAKI